MQYVIRSGDGTLCVIQCARGRPVNVQADNIIDRDYIAQTERLIRPHIRRTPIMEVDAADFGLVAARLSFKLELLQHSGAFKTRGAFANLLTR
jgi:threonine dehydratase